jgi:hypothetical protein
MEPFIANLRPATTVQLHGLRYQCGMATMHAIVLTSSSHPHNNSIVPSFVGGRHLRCALKFTIYAGKRKCSTVELSPCCQARFGEMADVTDGEQVI